MHLVQGRDSFPCPDFFVCPELPATRGGARIEASIITFVLLKNGPPVARLVPNNEKVCTGLGLAEALAKTGLAEDEAAAWHRDLQTARKTLKTTADKWR